MQPKWLSELNPLPSSDKFVSYRPDYNKALVTEANKDEIKMEEQNLRGIVPSGLYQYRNDKWWAENLMLPLWYNYPDLYTAAGGGKIDYDKIMNFKLKCVTPVISDMVSDQIKKKGFDPMAQGPQEKKGKDIKDWKISKKITIAGIEFKITLTCKLSAKYTSKNIKGASDFIIDSITTSEKDSGYKLQAHLKGFETLFNGENRLAFLSGDFSGSYKISASYSYKPDPNDFGFKRPKPIASCKLDPVGFSGTFITIKLGIDGSGKTSEASSAKGCKSLSTLRKLNIKDPKTLVFFTHWDTDPGSAIKTEISSILGTYFDNWIGDRLGPILRPSVEAALKNMGPICP